MQNALCKTLPDIFKDYKISFKIYQNECFDIHRGVEFNEKNFNDERIQSAVEDIAHYQRIKSAKKTLGYSFLFVFVTVCLASVITIEVLLHP
jgi:hypothetical protein